MKKGWRAMAASLAVLVGISGAAFGQNRQQQQPANNARTAEFRAPQRPQVQPQRPAEPQRPAQQPERTQVQRPDNDHNFGAQDHHVPVPIYRPANGDHGDRDHGRPVVIVRQPVYTAPVYVEPTYGYYGDAYVAPVSYSTAAQQAGFQDGLADGHNDWVMGFGFRSGYDENYINADNGFDSDFGSLTAYQAAYRIAYQQGYTQGYGR